jgi:hypothetical protein
MPQFLHGFRDRTLPCPHVFQQPLNVQLVHFS